MITLYNQNGHRNLMFHDLTGGAMVQANQHIIVHGQEGMVLDPGGHKVYTKLFAELSMIVPPKGLKYLFFSHQDPDIVAAANGWLMVTEAVGYVSALWTRFIPHFGIDELVMNRVKPIEDAGMTLALGSVDIQIIPAHFLHSPGNFHVYDPVSKILYSGDLGASIGAPYAEVTDFDAHIQYMKPFHERFIASQAATQAWGRAIANLDIETIAPQHGAVFRGKELSQRFISWVQSFPCGIDHIDRIYGLST